MVQAIRVPLRGSRVWVVLALLQRGQRSWAGKVVAAQSAQRLPINCGSVSGQVEISGARAICDDTSLTIIGNEILVYREPTIDQLPCMCPQTLSGKRPTRHPRRVMVPCHGSKYGIAGTPLSQSSERESYGSVAEGAQVVGHGGYRYGPCGEPIAGRLWFWWQ